MKPRTHCSMQFRFHGHIALALASPLILLSSLSTANAQERKAPVATPGDTLSTPGPLAHLSPKLTRRDLAKAMRLVADWQLGRMPAEPQTDWTWAALYDGFMAVPDKVAGDKYKQAMLGIAEQLKWQPGPRVMHADDQAVGQMYMEQYFLHNDPKMMEAMRARLDTEMATPDPTDPKRPLWWWCDALFMAPPVYADMARATGEQKYLTYMDHEWDIATNLLYDNSKHLYFRDATFLDKHEKNGEPLFWSRGNGWVMGGIVRVLMELPADSPLRPKFVALLKEMSAEMLSIQGKDGLWRPGLLDADSYPLPENSGSGFIAYAMAWGANEGILDRATYWPAVEKAWAGMLTHVYADGRLGSIQPVGAAPGAYSETSSYVYGVGAYLLAGSEIYRGVK
ncbi:Glycosyl hydrolase family 88 [Candidatus Sulfotelmatomonas gaucii]|uniref:Glycosyl hydrolase family 88 n=1 Tax=Candidatus Sulfuritelmatomonas gaucii TaxID=2043161 RepID=A0A2N9LJQ0_9BACT|nr:Glycosyl hydrolase family 88 [Candidatus Sulfotelmatomonas gaucii]